jgi:hypothetical protein
MKVILSEVISMKKIKLFMLLLVVISLAACLVGCDSSEKGGESPSDSSDGLQNNASSDLKLLRIEKSDSLPGLNNGYNNGLNGNDFQINSAVKPAAALHNSKSAGSQAVMTAGETFEEINSETVCFVAVIKNENRASFIDMVVYNSQNGKTVVYNEGNGAYQCSSETVYEDGVWVTNIRFNINAELCAEDFYFEIKEIKFLRNNSDEKADLNTVDVRKKNLIFSTEYFDSKATQKIEQDAEFFKSFDNVYVGFDFASKAVSLDCGIYHINDENITSDEVESVEIFAPETILLKYYENKVLKTGEFKVEKISIKAVCVNNRQVNKIQKLTLHAPVMVYETKVENLIYAEGVKICPLSDYLHWCCSFSIPSTCEEISSHIDQYELFIKYNGTTEGFMNIKGAVELVSHMKESGKSFSITCTNGTITSLE